MRINMLPNSFESNTSERMLNFLTESNRIEGIEKVNYIQQPEYQTVDKGHFGAFILSQNAAFNREPLTLRKVREWQALITKEQISLGEEINENEIGHIRSPSLPKNVRIGRHTPPSYNNVPTLIDALIERINEELHDQEKLKDDAEFCKFLGRSFQEFESIHPFGDGNGRTGRLIANYITTYCRRPIIVFNSELTERNSYIRAHDTSEKMVQFMAKKVQEAIFSSEGKILFKTGEAENPTVIYRSPDQTIQESYEWHILNSLFK